MHAGQGHEYDECGVHMSTKASSGRGIFVQRRVHGNTVATYKYICVSFLAIDVTAPSGHKTNKTLYLGEGGRSHEFQRVGRGGSSRSRCGT